MCKHQKLPLEHLQDLKKHVSTWYQKVVFVDSFSLHNNSMTTELFIYLFNSFFKQIHLGAGVRHIAVFTGRCPNRGS